MFSKKSKLLGHLSGFPTRTQSCSIFLISADFRGTCESTVLTFSSYFYEKDPEKEREWNEGGFWRKLKLLYDATPLDPVFAYDYYRKFNEHIAEAEQEREARTKAQENHNAPTKKRDVEGLFPTKHKKPEKFEDTERTQSDDEPVWDDVENPQHDPDLIGYKPRKFPYVDELRAYFTDGSFDPIEQRMHDEDKEQYRKMHQAARVNAARGAGKRDVEAGSDEKLSAEQRKQHHKDLKALKKLFNGIKATGGDTKVILGLNDEEMKDLLHDREPLRAYEVALTNEEKAEWNKDMELVQRDEMEVHGELAKTEAEARNLSNTPPVILTPKELTEWNKNLRAIAPAKKGKGECWWDFCHSKRDEEHKEAMLGRTQAVEAREENEKQNGPNAEAGDDVDLTPAEKKLEHSMETWQ